MSLQRRRYMRWGLWWRNCPITGPFFRESSALARIQVSQVYIKVSVSCDSNMVGRVIGFRGSLDGDLDILRVVYSIMGVRIVLYRSPERT